MTRSPPATPMSHDPEAPLFDPAHADTPSSLTRRDLLALLFKHKWLILTTWLVVTVLVAWALMSLPPRYVATAKLLVKTEQQGRPSLLSGIAAYREALDTDPSNRKLENEMEILSSRPLAEAVVKQLDLQYDQVYHPPYVHLLKPVGRLIEYVKTQWFGYPPGDKRRFDDTVDALQKSLLVAPAKSRGGEAAANIIELRLQSADGGVAPAALVVLLEHYRRFSTVTDQNSGERAYKLVHSRVREAAAAVEAAQRRLENVSSRDARGGNGMPLTSGSKPPLANEQELPEAMRTMTNVPILPGDSVAAALRARLTQMEIELAAQEQVFTSRVDSVNALKGAIGNLRTRLKDESRRSANDSSLVAERQRELRMAEDLYFDLQRKLTQIGLFLQMNPEQEASRVIIEPPLRPDSSEWKRDVVIGLAASVAGLLLGLMIAALRDFTDHRLSRPQDVERHLGVPLLTVIDRVGAPALRQLTEPWFPT